MNLATVQTKPIQRARGPFDGTLAQRLVYWADFAETSHMKNDMLAAARAIAEIPAAKPTPKSE